MFKIAELLVATQGKLIQGSQKAIAKGISIDSRTINSGEAFIALKGNNFNGHCFIEEAIKKGASCIIIELGCNKPQARNTAFIEVRDTIKALGDIAGFQRGFLYLGAAFSRVPAAQRRPAFGVDRELPAQVGGSYAKGEIRLERE